MESQVPRQQGFKEEEQHTSFGMPAGEHEQNDDHHEKKSVLKNVKEKAKAKAKKIKETLAHHDHGHGHEHDGGHGHGHEHDGGHGHGHEHDRGHGHSHETHEEDDADEEMIEDPEVHGAPIYESAAVRSGVMGGDRAGKPLGGNLEKPTTMHEDRYDSKITEPSSESFGKWEAENEKQSSHKYTKQTGGNIGNPTGMEENPIAPKDMRVPSNYQSKVASPIGDVYESPVVGSGVTCGDGAGQQVGVNLEKPTTMHEDRYDSKITEPPSEPFGHWEEKNGKQSSHKYTKQTGGNIGNPMSMEEDPNAPKDVLEPSNYQSKVADLTGNVGKETGITPILQSLDKMSVHDEPHEQKNPDNKPQKMFSGSHNQFSPEPVPAGANPDDPGSVLKAFADSGEQKQGGYMDKISSATSAVTDKAIAAKNIVASKLGYGGKEESGLSSDTDVGERSGGIMGTAADYGYKAAATVSEKTAPVTEKMTNVVNTVLAEEKGSETTVAPEKGQAAENKEPSKGMKEYLAEKFSPSEEDKALSEVITDTLHRKKSEEAEEKPIGKVAVSDEVARHLGTGVDEQKKEGTETRKVESNVSPAVMGRMRDTVSSWFGIGKGDQSSQASLGTTYAGGDEQFSGSTGEEARQGHDNGGERRLQESSN